MKNFSQIFLLTHFFLNFSKISHSFGNFVGKMLPLNITIFAYFCKISHILNFYPKNLKNFHKYNQNISHKSVQSPKIPKIFQTKVKTYLFPDPLVGNFAKLLQMILQLLSSLG